VRQQLRAAAVAAIKLGRSTPTMIPLRFRPALLVLCSLLLMGGGLFARQDPAGANSAPPHSTAIRVITYNIHHGVGLDEKLDLARIAALIKAEDADLVALQEVDRGVERTAKRDLPAELAELTGMKVYFGPNIRYQGGDYGNAVLTKFPIKQAKNSPLTMVGKGEQRGVIQLVLDVRGTDVLFMDTHLDSRREEAERTRSAGELVQLIAAAGQMPVMVCGDFNTVPATPAHVKMKTALADTWELIGQESGLTSPTENPRRRIDYLWISTATIELLQVKVLRSNASDHLPVFGEFRLREVFTP
jgi:endonuclease/exonuclease/phosphatase family metal-dependent hydrolase